MKGEVTHIHGIISPNRRKRLLVTKTVNRTLKKHPNSGLFFVETYRKQLRRNFLVQKHFGGGEFGFQGI